MSKNLLHNGVQGSQGDPVRTRFTILTKIQLVRITPNVDLQTNAVKGKDVSEEEEDVDDSLHKNVSPGMSGICLSWCQWWHLSLVSAIDNNIYWLQTRLACTNTSYEYLVLLSMKYFCNSEHY